MFRPDQNKSRAVLPKVQIFLRQKGSRVWQASRVNRAARVLLGPALIVAGAALLVYVGTQYSRMYAEQHRLAKQWQQQNEPGATPAPADDGLTKLVIPKINLDAIVVEGTTRRQLLLGPGHMRETPAPGEVGNSVITAHRDTFFRHIYELNKGDILEVRRSGKTYTYEVTGKKVTDPEDLSVLRSSKDKRLTLITCYPTYYIGPAPDRLVVFAKMVEAQGAGEGVQAANKRATAHAQ
jgi:LPXTG-site transpeptidase (sortase) family protein